MPVKKINKVSIIMGSQSDFKTMKLCQKTLKILKIKFQGTMKELFKIRFGIDIENKEAVNTSTNITKIKI